MGGKRAGRVLRLFPGKGCPQIWLTAHQQPPLPQGTKQGLHLQPFILRDAQAGLREGIMKDLPKQVCPRWKLRSMT